MDSESCGVRMPSPRVSRSKWPSNIPTSNTHFQGADIRFQLITLFVTIHTSSFLRAIECICQENVKYEIFAREEMAIRGAYTERGADREIGLYQMRIAYCVGYPRILFIDCEVSALSIQLGGFLV